MHIRDPATDERVDDYQAALGMACRRIPQGHNTVFTRILCSGLLIVLTFSSTAMPAFANAGPISVGGQIVAEPIAIKNISISRETLTIDLRPTVENDPALVEAIYRLDNTGSAARHQLLFASGTNGDNQFVITLDDTVLTSETIAASLPPEWKPPLVTPGISGSEDLEYGGDLFGNSTSVVFTAEIAPGLHTLKVCYHAHASMNLSGDPLVYHQFAYVLAPAKSWEHFGGLDVTIRFPEGWSIACTPEMARDGDTLRGSFTDIPADAVAITIQAPTPPAYERYKQISKVLLIAVVLIGPIICAVMSFRVGRRAERAASVGLTGVASGIMSAAVVAVVGWTAVYGIEQLLPTDQIARYGYGELFAVIGIIFLTFAVWILSTALAVVIGLIAFRKKKSLTRK
jgi:hypothetical protein